MRQSALLIALLAFEISQPVPVQSIPVALRLNLTPVVRIVVLGAPKHAYRTLIKIYPYLRMPHLIDLLQAMRMGQDIVVQ